MFWTPVVAGYGTLTEVQLEWSIDDLADAHEALLIKAELEASAAERARR